MVDSGSMLLQGVALAQSDIEALKQVEKKCRAFFDAFLASVDCDEYDGFQFIWQQERYALKLSVDNGGAETWVATVEYSLPRNELHFWDARLSTKYPLPLKEESLPVLARYFGVSLGWQAHGSHLLKLPGVGNGLRIELKDQP